MLLILCRLLLPGVVSATDVKHDNSDRDQGLEPESL